jgi:Amt family ammonium transporter
VRFSEALDVTPCLNGILSGLVASSSICAYVPAYAALVTGILSGAVYVGASKLLLKLKVDDPLDVVPVHFVSGVLSLLMAGLFATPYGLEAAE